MFRNSEWLGQRDSRSPATGSGVSSETPGVNESKACTQEGGHILRLPTELLSMIFDHLVDEDKPWLAHLLIVCKAFLPGAEATLWNTLAIKKFTDASETINMIREKPYLAAFVHELVLFANDRRTSLAEPLDDLLPLLADLRRVNLIGDDTELLRVLHRTPSRLRALTVAGKSHALLLVEELLAAQPEVVSLTLILAPCNVDDQLHALSRPDDLQRMQRLTFSAETLPFSSTFQYPYPVTHLSAYAVSHGDLIYALKLFSNIPVAAFIVRTIDSECDLECFWPTRIFADVRLPHLAHLKICDKYDEYTDLCGDDDTMAVPGLGGRCPALKSIIWGADRPTMDALFWPHADPDTSAKNVLMDRYACMLFERVPTLERLGVYQCRDADMEAVYEKRLEGEVYERAEDRSLVGPEYKAMIGRFWSDSPTASSQDTLIRAAATRSLGG
ncbi:hypothetical protein C8Q77DRAFT_165080 [Trametes polyzona]|nr:hypothetical protein C8Q77DRAFT_165080 [Trametes polyzona]